MGVSTYRPQDVAVIVGGHILSGFADGSFVNVERNEDSFSLTVGSDGEGCRGANNNRSGKFTFTLGQWSKSNTFLTALITSDELSGDGIIPVLVKDNSGTSLHSAEEAWVVKPAAAGYDREPQNREWVVETHLMVTAPGSN